MAITLRKITKKIFIAGNLTLSAANLIAILVPVLDPATYWWSGLMGLGFPAIALLQTLFVLFWFLFRSKWIFLPLALLVASIQQLGVLFAMPSSQEWKEEKEPQTLRVLSWNVSRWDEYNKHLNRNSSFREIMMDYVEVQNADVLCFQEFFESSIIDYYKPNIVEFTKRMGYPYFYFAIETSIFNGKYHLGNIIFSRYPIIDSSKVSFKSNARGENVMACDIIKGSDTIRVVNTHLQSVLFSEDDYKGIEGVKKNEGNVLNTSKNIVSKLKRAYESRSIQAKKVATLIQKSPYPVITCGDFNDVPNSYTYFTIRGTQQDCFLEQGMGLGRTFRMISPTLRIDFILASKDFEVQQFYRPKPIYSDHYPQMTDLVLQPKSVKPL